MITGVTYSMVTDWETGLQWMLRSCLSAINLSMLMLNSQTLDNSISAENLSLQSILHTEWIIKHQWTFLQIEWTLGFQRFKLKIRKNSRAAKQNLIMGALLGTAKSLHFWNNSSLSGPYYTSSSALCMGILEIGGRGPGSHSFKRSLFPWPNLHNNL